MKIKVIVTVEDKGGISPSVEYTLSIGNQSTNTERKTFHWLGIAASHRFSLTAPNGILRSRELCESPNTQCQYIPKLLRLNNGYIPRNSEYIIEYMKEYDSVYVTLAKLLPANEATSLVIKHNADIISQDYDNNNEIFDNASAQSSVNYMKIMLKSQLFDNIQLHNQARNIFNKINILFPKLIDIKDDFIDCLSNNLDLCREIFGYFSSNKNYLTLEEVQNFVDSCSIFEIYNDSPNVTSRLFNKTLKLSQVDGNELDFNSFFVLLLLLSQSRFHDTFEKESRSLGLIDAFNSLIIKFIKPFALTKNFVAELKGIFLSQGNLLFVNSIFESLYQVYDRYKNKAVDLPNTLKYQILSELLYDSHLQEEDDFESTKLLFKYVTSGTLNGRDQSIAELEFTFAEFIEAVSYAGYFKFYVHDPTLSLASTIQNIIISYKKGLEYSLKTMNKPDNGIKKYYYERI